MATAGNGQSKTKKIRTGKKEGMGLTRHVEMGTGQPTLEFQQVAVRALERTRINVVVERDIYRLTKNLYGDEVGSEQRKNNNGPHRSLGMATTELGDQLQYSNG